MPHYKQQSDKAFIISRIGHKMRYKQIVENFISNCIQKMWGIVGNCVILKRFI